MPAMAAALAVIGAVMATLFVLRPRLVPAVDGPARDGYNWVISDLFESPRLRFHPESHFWPLQLVETGILLTLAAIATLAAFVFLRRRHG